MKNIVNLNLWNDFSTVMGLHSKLVCPLSKGLIIYLIKLPSVVILFYYWNSKKEQTREKYEIRNFDVLKIDLDKGRELKKSKLKVHKRKCQKRRFWIC